MAAVWMRLSAELRRRWRAWLGLALVFGLAGGATIAAAAGARRTASAYPRFVEAQDGFDAITGGGAEENYAERYAALKRHPMIADAVESFIVGLQVEVPARRGRPKQVLSMPDVFVGADPSGRMGYETNRSKVLEGRLVDRTRTDETMVPFTFAERYGVELGDRIVAGIGFGENFPEPVRFVPLRVVGIVASPGDFDAVGQSTFLFVPVSPALYHEYRDLLPPFPPPVEPIPDLHTLGVHLKGGPVRAAAFKRSVETDLNIDVPMIEPVITSGVQKSMRLYADALWLVAALLGVATILIAGQTMARQQMLESQDHPELRSLGASTGQLFLVGMVRAAATGAVAAAIATPVAYLLSPLSPIGTPRVAEPTPGFAFDGAAIGLGSLAIVLTVPLLALWPSIRAARRTMRDRSAEQSTGPSRIAARASRISSSPVTVTGLRLALEPGRGRTAVPVRSTILAVAVGVAAVVGSLGVGGSLNHLIENPELTGFTYDAIMPNESGEPNEALDARLRAFPFIEDTTFGTGLNVNFSGVDSFLVAFDQGGSIGFATIDGRPPTDTVSGGLPEIAIGPATERRLGVDIGDVVTFAYPDEENDEDRRQQARVVGVAAIPALPWAATEPGEGAVMTVGGIATFSPEDQGGCCFLRFKPGTDLVAAEQALEDAGFEVFIRTKRSDLATLERISRLPIALSSAFASIAAAALAHVLVSGIRRRSRDLAILKTLGFVQRQVRGVVAWQASAVAVLSLVVGIPAGMALGRWGWRLVAGQFGVVPVAVQPVLALALLLPSAILLANLVAAIPGRLAARTQPALVLRTE